MGSQRRARAANALVAVPIKVQADALVTIGASTAAVLAKCRFKQAPDSDKSLLSELCSPSH
jgi:hypothetical protein